MGPAMYKQRPAYAALIAAACVLLLGACTVFELQRRISYGDGNFSSPLFIGCLTCAISGALVISAFSRYQFTHLWRKDTAPASLKKKPFQRDH